MKALLLDKVYVINVMGNSSPTNYSIHLLCFVIFTIFCWEIQLKDCNVDSLHPCELSYINIL